MRVRPVRAVELVRPKRSHQAHERCDGTHRILQRHPDARHRVAELVEARGVLHVDQRKRVVVFEHARQERAGDMEPAHSRDEAARRGGGFRRDDHDVVADLHPQLFREIGAENDVVRAVLQIGERAGSQLLPETRGPRFLSRKHPAHHHASHALLVGNERLRFDVRGGGDDAGLSLHGLLYLAPVIDGAVYAHQHRV